MIVNDVLASHVTRYSMAKEPASQPSNNEIV